MKPSRLRASRFNLVTQPLLSLLRPSNCSVKFLSFPVQSATQNRSSRSQRQSKSNRTLVQICGQVCKISSVSCHEICELKSVERAFLRLIKVRLSLRTSKPARTTLRNLDYVHASSALNAGRIAICPPFGWRCREVHLAQPPRAFNSRCY